MYNFESQQKMLSVSLALLEEKGIKNISAIGGGTALAAYYWDHRYSTDIDIFIYGGRTEYKDTLRPAYWSDDIKDKMESLGFEGDYKIQTIYLEFTINQNEKMQFFDVIPFTKNPYNLVSLWGMDLNIETVAEIIAKKIHYRCEKGNARDIFDIALAIHKQPDIFLNLGRLKLERLRLLFQTVKTIKNDKKLSEEYLHEIEEMNPNVEYKILSTNAIYYLYDFLENYLGAKDLGIDLAKEDLIEIENYVFKIY
jgi:hypothetical protein